MKTTPARKAEMVTEWKAQRLIWVKVASKAKDEIRCLDEMIDRFGEANDGTSRT